MVPPRSDPSRNRLLLVQVMLIAMLFVALTLSALTDQKAPPVTPTPFVNEIATQSAVTRLANITPTVEALTAEVVDTPTASLTPTAPATPTRPPLPTPASEPIVRTGTGDAVFYPQKWIGPAVVRITHGGSGAFAAWTQDDNGKRDLTLANVIGAYDGYTLIDFLEVRRTLRFEVRTADAWHIEVLPLSMARHAGYPGIITGSGDEVIVLDGSATPDRLSVEASNAWGTFTIWAFGEPSSQLVNVVAPYSGTMPLPPSTLALAVKATGPWRLEVVAR